MNLSHRICNGIKRIDGFYRLMAFIKKEVNLFSTSFTFIYCKLYALSVLLMLFKLAFIFKMVNFI